VPWASLRRSLAVAVALWLLSTVAGFWLVSSIGGTTAAAIPIPMPIPQGHPPIASSDAFIGILARNLAVFVGLLLGLVTAGISAAALLCFNGIVFGRILAVARLAGLSAADMAQAVVPHAVLEIPGLMIGGGIGLLGFPLFCRWVHGRAPISRAGRFNRLLARLALLGVLLLGIAAALEAWISVDPSGTVG
jgi:uncharacterized membrane protein SpoIIM required for sporulation